MADRLRCMVRKYYEAYDERYKTVHAKGFAWAGEEATEIVAECIRKYAIGRSQPMLELGCGEGRDAAVLLERGYRLRATDVSGEAIAYCRNHYPAFRDSFQVLDCVSSEDPCRYDFIYAIAVVHMLLLDEDRKAFYRFVREHLTDQGVALIAAMGDGETEITTDVRDAFRLLERNHPSGKMLVAGTSLRMVSFPKFESELAESGLQICEKGFTSREPDFDSLMYAVALRDVLPKGRHEARK